jgi:hypothetical protein
MAVAILFVSPVWKWAAARISSSPFPGLPGNPVFP